MFIVSQSGSSTHDIPRNHVHHALTKGNRGLSGTAFSTNERSNDRHLFVLLPHDSLTCSSQANRLEYLLTQKWKNTRTRRKERFRGDAVIHSDLHPFKPKKCSSGFRIDFHQYEGKLGIPNQKVFRKYRLSAEAIYFFVLSLLVVFS